MIVMNQERIILKVRKRTVFEWATLWIILLPLFLGVAFDALHLPRVITYTADLAWLILAFAMFFRKSTTVKKMLLPLMAVVLGFFVYTLVIYLFRFQSPLYYLWGARNNFRYYIFFFAVVFFITQEDVKTIFRFLDVLFWINAVVILIQYFAFGYEQDYLGGIFGVSKGCNAYTIIFLCIIIGASLLRYMDKQESTWLCFSKCAVSLLISVIAELKVFFVFFLIILAVASVLSRFSWRKVMLIAVCAILLFIGVSLLVQVFKWDEFSSLEGIWKLATQENYSSAQTVNRLSAIPTLARTILNRLDERILGLGLGNCDASTFDFLNTPFHQRYSYLRYTWFSCARLFLEVGYIGLAFYIGFFVLCIFLIWRYLKRGVGNKFNHKLGIIMAVLCIILMFYNSSLHTESGYMAYFVLALPFLPSVSEGVEQI